VGFASRAGAAFSSVTLLGALHAGRASAELMPTPLDGIGNNVVRAFTEPVPLVLYGGAIVSTVVMAPTGADHGLRVAVVENLHAPIWGDGAYYGGYVLPLAVPVGLYVSGLIAGSGPVAGAGSAALQALAVTFATSVILKVGTGRPFPLHGGDPNAPDRLQHPEYAREFVPFGFEGRYAWPSGHTSSAIAVAAALSAFSESIAVPLVAYPIATSIGLGMIVADRHWTSDVIAGACIGQAIGWSIGSAFRERNRGGAPSRARLRFVPLLGEIRGLALAVEN
jgi:membrane-associated phospholipid phosphatase